ncbi:thiamine phosphate synthase [Vibrio sp. ZSDE26]|uniref:Thiamine phosphate synthase n=1 Tax=Vibrio amylolyticus TaxID=2847292 RepID=A0A9X2BJ96_9VIBR|nr:thiamine phosphate synthase [Vibrio amylolyticus]MCK6265579.1 thiamine phosphate synthase [Vibrio amylolyticus]
MKILIPSDHIELTGLVQNCLLIAEKEGFGIHHIELGVSPTQQFSIIGESGSFNILANNLNETDNEVCFSQSDLSACDFAIHYQSRMNLAQVSRLLKESTNLAIIGTQDNSESDHKECIDAWRLGAIISVFNGETTDVINSDSSNKAIKYPLREANTELHLAWFISAYALDFPVEDSLVLARAVAQNSVSRETWPNDYQFFPIPVIDDERLDIAVGWADHDSMVSFPSLEKISLGLYPVVDDVNWIRRLLPLGIKTIQLRIKDHHQDDLENQIIESIKLGEEHDAKVFINDHWQLAIKHNAFGVHLGQEDIEESNLNQLSNANIRLGLSTHGFYELLRIVQINPSYIALGHIFPTTTKEMPSRPQGLVRLAMYQSLIDTIPYTDTTLGYPTVAIGGIDHSTAQAVWDCGVSSLAVVRAITLAEDTTAAIEPFKQIMNEELERFNAHSLSKQYVSNQNASSQERESAH